MKSAALVEPVADQLLYVRGVQRLEGQLRQVAATEQLGLAAQATDPELGASAAGAHIVEGGDRLGHMERLGMGRGDRGEHTDLLGRRRDARSDQRGVEPTADLVGAAVAGDLVRGLQVSESSIVTKSSSPRWASGSKSTQ
jgi:hypothetical protein